jgi:hypothetical protein
MMSHEPTGRAGCAAAQPAQPLAGYVSASSGNSTQSEVATSCGDTPRAWTAAPPLPYRDDTNPPPHWFWIELGPRIRRRPRCDEGD